MFSFEGGCYAKTIDLDKNKEPDIYKAIKRDALLENVSVNAEGVIDYFDTSVTQNTRVSYPIYHIDNIVKPISKELASKIIFLAMTLLVLPPVSKLTYDQAEYHFLSGFTAKTAGTEGDYRAAANIFCVLWCSFFNVTSNKVFKRIIKKNENF